MTKARDIVEAPTVEPADCLRLAMNSDDPAEASRYARAGLARAERLRELGGEADAEATLLLLRELFKAHVRAGRPRSAHAIARKMTRLGVLSEIAHADLGRACAALGWFERAGRCYRLAARFAPATRRATHWSACAMALWNAGRHDEALAALDRATRWSSVTRPLHRAQAAMVEQSRGTTVGDLEEIIADLDASRAAEGYGRFVLGTLAHGRGEHERAGGLLREFIARNERDPLRAATLAGELTRARAILRGDRERAR